ncbi:MAG: phospholipase A [Thermoanaerobaculia bacterium]|jgi:phospholipase A1|nr:phospholipase A [Thermoanaerobaculia bacterium]MBP9824370.1 phospholipase A [Thermoanaerobaculia bacterium]
MILPKALRGLALVLIHSLAPLAATSALAQVETISPEGCVGIDSDFERLACYDRAVGRHRRPGGIEEAPQATSPDSAPESSPTTPQREPFVGPPPPAEMMARPAVAGGLAEAGPPVASSLLDSRWELTRNAKLGTFGMRAFKPVYLLPAFYTDSPNQFPSSPEPGHSVTESENLDEVEAKFQISFKTKIAQELFGHRGDLWFGYTQSSRWQVYNSELSRPFRETNYEPELMLVFHTSYELLGLDGRLLGVSLNHQSNGTDLPYSRSWNRVIGMIGFERDAWTLVARPWWRLPEVAGGEDNPDLEDYAGRGDLLLVRRLREHEISLMARHSLRGGASSHGAVELGWVFPIHRDLKGYLQIFHGYAESLIDYNQSSTRIGLGISLLEWY